MQSNVETLIAAALHLPPEDREAVLRALQNAPRGVPSRHITELRGLGKGLWNGTDAQDYVNAERDAWIN